MPNFDFNIAVSYTPEDNNTKITKREFFFKDCGPWAIPEDCDLWSVNKCPNDDNYCQPFIEGDFAYFQFILPLGYYPAFAAQIINTAANEEVFPEAIETQIGKDPTLLTRLINIKIDTSLLEGIDCWYLKLTLWKCKTIRSVEGITLQQCIDSAVEGGATLAEATIECMDERCDFKEQVYSEPFCRVKCDEETLLIQGVYTKYDCDKFYYGDLLVAGNSVPSIYQLEFRVPAYILNDGADITETSEDGIVTKVSTKKGYIFQTKKIPPYVANQLVRAFGSRAFYIDGLPYTRGGSLRIGKDFDEGKSWIVKTRLFTECADQDLTCE